MVAEAPNQPSQGQKIALWLMGGLLVFALCALTFLGGYWVRLATHKDKTVSIASAGTAPNAPAADGSQGFGVLDEIYQTLKDNYIDPTKVSDFDTLKASAITGLLNAVGDPNQVYIPPQDIDNTTIDESGQYEGIGATMKQDKGQVKIDSITPDYPASKSNLRPGDTLLAVDGQDLSGKTTNDVVKLVRGKAGTQVTLSVQHQNGQKEDITLTRSAIILKSTHADQILDAQGNAVTDVAYLRISQFQNNTDDEVAQFIQGLKGKNYKGLILDLRNNPGGGLDTTINILNDLLKPGQTELIQKDRDGHQAVQKASAGRATLDPNLPLVVLVNKNSASASELTSGALKDNKRATIIGEQTYGKGTVDQFFKLPKDGGLLYVSIRNWLTPGGTLIQGTGITPDIVVHPSDTDDPSPSNYENAQLYRAIDFVRNGK